jgi:hypothetical protein
VDVFSLSRQVSWLTGRNCFRSSQCQGISDVKSGATRCLQLRGQRRNPAQDARTTDFPLSYQILRSSRTVTSICGSIRHEVSMGRKSHTQKFLVANLTSRENQARQAAVAVSSHAPFRKWRLSGASPLADFSESHWPLWTVSFSRSRGRDRDPNTGAGWGLPVVDRIALDRVTAAMDGDYPRTGRSTHAPRANVQTLKISYRWRAG